jgi:PhnB protein
VPCVEIQLSVRHGREAVTFYEAAFGAQTCFRHGGTDELPGVVAQLQVGSTRFWVEDESPDHGNFSPQTLGGATTRLLLIVDDPAAAVDRALTAGAREIHPVAEVYGWLLGRVADPFGHHWEIGRPLGPWPPAGGDGKEHP